MVQLTLGFAPHVAHEARSGFSLISLAIVPSSVSSISIGEHVVYRPIWAIGSRLAPKLFSAAMPTTPPSSIS